MTIFRSALIIIAAMALVSCGPDVGSPEWCKAMKEKDQGSWTLDETSDYTNYCVLGLKPK